MPAVAQNQNSPSILDAGANYSVPAASGATFANLLPRSTYLGWSRPQLIGKVINAGGSENFRSFSVDTGGGASSLVSIWGINNVPAPPLTNGSTRFLVGNWQYSFFLSQQEKSSADNVFAYGSWYCLGITWDSTIPVIKIFLGTETTPMAEVAYQDTIAGVGFPNATTGAADGPHSRDVPVTVFPGQSSMLLMPRLLTLGEMESWRFRPRMLPGAVAWYDFGRAAANATQPDQSGNGAHMVRGKTGFTTLAVTEVPGPQISSLLPAAAA